MSNNSITILEPSFDGKIELTLSRINFFNFFFHSSIGHNEKISRSVAIGCIALLCDSLNLEHITQSLEVVFVSTVFQITEVDAISIFK